jgi:hypothetical protein
MIQLNIQPPARINKERVNLVAVLAVLDEINGADGYDTEVVCERILPRLADDLRQALASKTCLSTHLEQRIEARDREIARLERQLDEAAVLLDAERTLFEFSLRELHDILMFAELEPDAAEAAKKSIAELLLRF